MYIYSEEKYCYDCGMQENKLNDIKYWLIHLVKQLYTSEDLDKQELERTLEELCQCADVQVPKEDLKIERTVKPERQDYKKVLLNMVNDWKKLNFAHIKSLS